MKTNTIFPCIMCHASKSTLIKNIAYLYIKRRKF